MLFSRNTIQYIIHKSVSIFDFEEMYEINVNLGLYLQVCKVLPSEIYILRRYFKLCCLFVLSDLQRRAKFATIMITITVIAIAFYSSSCCNLLLQ